MANDYNIGFGKPPKATQWQKGDSGNPKGRPKTRPDILNDAAAILSEPVTARTPDGRTVSLDGYEAAYMALCKKGLKGHVPSLIKAIRIMLEVQPVLEARAEEDQHRRTRVLDLLQRMGVKVNG